MAYEEREKYKEGKFVLERWDTNLDKLTKFRIYNIFLIFSIDGNLNRSRIDVLCNPLGSDIDEAWKME